MNIEIVEPIITAEFTLEEALEFVDKNVPGAGHVPVISLLIAEKIRKKILETKQKMEKCPKYPKC